MNKLKQTICVVLFAASSLAVTSCGSDNPKKVDAAPEIDSNNVGSDAAGCVCDPVGTLSMQAALANVAVPSDTEVITPLDRNPGCPGPAGLP